MMLFLGIMFGAAFTRANMQLKESDFRISDQQAFYGAEIAVEFGSYFLRRFPDWRPGFLHDPIEDIPLDIDPNDLLDPPVEGIIGFGSLAISDADDFLDTWESVWIRGIGDSAGESLVELTPGPNMRRTIFARAIIIRPATYFAYTLGDLRIGSGSVFNGDVYARNITFDIDEESYPDPGDPERRIVFNNGAGVDYINEVEGYWDGEGGLLYPDDIFIDQDPVESPAITMTGVDLNQYRAAAELDGYVVPTSEPCSETPDFVDLDSIVSNNGIIFSECNVTVSGTYDTSTVVVTGGDIYIVNNIESDTGVSPAPQLGLFAANDVYIDESAPNTLNVQAFVKADGGVFETLGATYKDELNFTGSIAARGKTDQNAIVLGKYRERNYSFNQELLFAPTIPMNLSDVGIVSWEEVDDDAAFPPVESISIVSEPLGQ